MKKKLMTGILIGSIVFSGCQTAFGQEVIWKYSVENMEKTYAGEWVESSADFQFFLPTEGWEEDTSGSELTEETETEEYPEALGTETEAETAAGIETEDAETMTGGETPVLMKLKEIWTWLGKGMELEKDRYKAVLKCKTLADYNAVVNGLLM